jgi:hypothetical protein
MVIPPATIGRFCPNTCHNASPSPQIPVRREIAGCRNSHSDLACGRGRCSLVACGLSPPQRNGCTGDGTDPKHFMNDADQTSVFPTSNMVQLPLMPRAHLGAITSMCRSGRHPACRRAGHPARRDDGPSHTERRSGRQDAALYGRQDACRYMVLATRCGLMTFRPGAALAILVKRRQADGPRNTRPA